MAMECARGRPPAVADTADWAAAMVKAPVVVARWRCSNRAAPAAVGSTTSTRLSWVLPPPPPPPPVVGVAASLLDRCPGMTAAAAVLVVRTGGGGGGGGGVAGFAGVAGVGVDIAGRWSVADTHPPHTIPSQPLQQDQRCFLVTSQHAGTRIVVWASRHASQTAMRAQCACVCVCGTMGLVGVTMFTNDRNHDVVR